MNDIVDVPGNIALCEWCGLFVNNFQQGKMVFCPKCHKPRLIDACQACGAPIPFPPQYYCFSCGKALTLFPITETPFGPISRDVAEPDAKSRARLEAGGDHWHDVTQGKAPNPEIPKVEPPIMPNSTLRFCAHHGFYVKLNGEECPRCTQPPEPLDNPPPAA